MLDVYVALTHGLLHLYERDCAVLLVLHLTEVPDSVPMRNSQCSSLRALYADALERGLLSFNCLQLLECQAEAFSAMRSEGVCSCPPEISCRSTVCSYLSVKLKPSQQCAQEVCAAARQRSHVAAACQVDTSPIAGGVLERPYPPPLTRNPLPVHPSRIPLDEVFHSY